MAAVERGRPVSPLPGPAASRLDAAPAIPAFERPVLLIWGDSCGFFPIPHGQRLASEFPNSTLVAVPGSKTWVPVDNPGAVAGAIAGFVPFPSPEGTSR